MIIRLVRKGLNAVMTDRYYRNPTDEALLTLLKEMEAPYEIGRIGVH